MKKPAHAPPYTLTLDNDLYAVGDSEEDVLVAVGSVTDFADGEYILEATERYPECVDLLHYALRIGVGTPGPFSRPDQVIRGKIKAFLEEIG